MKTYIRTKTYMQMFIAILLLSAETWKQPRYQVVNDKQIVMHPIEILESNTKKQINTCNI